MVEPGRLFLRFHSNVIDVITTCCDWSIAIVVLWVLIGSVTNFLQSLRFYRNPQIACSR